jgi:hypothetical protein
MMRKKALLFAIILYCGINTYCQNYVNQLYLQTRIDNVTSLYDCDSINNDSRFVGQYLNLILKGNINERLSYTFRQRLNKSNYDNNNIFKNTDFLYLDYSFNDKFSLSVGKQMVDIGGFEYDYAPIDVYFYSNFWKNISCYAFGISTKYNINKDNSLIFQICNSPFSKQDINNMYAYNLLWYGSFPHWKTIYSTNMIEYKRGHYINYIALGNRISVGHWDLDLDLMNRASTKQKQFFFKDYSIIGKLQYNINNKFSCYVKAGQDKNNAQENANLTAANYYDLCVIPNTDYQFYGLGGEYFPLKDSKDLRLHLFMYSNNDDNKGYYVNCGLTWNMKVINKNN